MTLDDIIGPGTKPEVLGQGYGFTEGPACRVVAFDVRTKAKRVLCSEIDGQHFNEPNDLAIDFLGGFYFSDPNYQHRGQPTVMKQDVYYCSAEGKATRVST